MAATEGATVPVTVVGAVVVGVVTSGSGGGVVVVPNGANGCVPVVVTAVVTGCVVPATGGKIWRDCTFDCRGRKDVPLNGGIYTPLTGGN